MSEIDERIAGEIDAIVDNCDRGHAFWSLVEPRDGDDADWAGTVAIPILGHTHDIPILGTIDSYTGDIAWLGLPEMDPNENYTDGPLPEPPAPPLTAENYAAGRMPFAAWLVGALGIGVAVAIAAVMVLVERVRRRA